MQQLLRRMKCSDGACPQEPPIAKLSMAVFQALSSMHQTSSATEKDRLDTLQFKHVFGRLQSELLLGGADDLQALFEAAEAAGSAVDDAAAAPQLAILYRHLLALNEYIQAAQRQNQAHIAAARVARLNQQAMRKGMRAEAQRGGAIPKMSIRWSIFARQSEPEVDPEERKSTEPTEDAIVFPSDGNSGELDESCQKDGAAALDTEPGFTKTGRSAFLELYCVWILWRLNAIGLASIFCTDPNCRKNSTEGSRERSAGWATCATCTSLQLVLQVILKYQEPGLKKHTQVLIKT